VKKAQSPQLVLSELVLSARFSRTRRLIRQTRRVVDFTNSLELEEMNSVLIQSLFYHLEIGLARAEKELAELKLLGEKNRNAA
jgi:hypothetical protein